MKISKVTALPSRRTLKTVTAFAKKPDLINALENIQITHKEQGEDSSGD